MLMRKYQFTFLHYAYEAVKDSSEQHTENHENHLNKWIISILLITHNTFKEVKWSSFWADKFCDPDFDISDSDDDENYARLIQFHHTTKALRISRGDTLAFKGNAFIVVDEEVDERHTNTIDLSLSSDFYRHYATWIKEYVQMKDDILETEKDFLWSTL